MFAAMNTSRIPLYDVHCVVRARDGKLFEGNGIVDSIEGAASYGQKEITNVSTRNGSLPCHESQIRKATLREVLFFRHPRTNAIRIGNNSALALFIGEPIAIACSWAFFALGGDTAFDQVIGWVFPGIAVIIPALLFGGAFLQYNRIWK